MDKFHTYHVHVKLVHQDLYEVIVSSATSWAPLLLSTHAETFYGTFVLEENNAKVPSLFLNGWQTVTLFATEHFHSYVEWIWDESCDFMFAISLPIFDAIIDKEWFIDYDQMEESFTWALPASVTDEFYDDLEKAIKES